jgi:hypothetical protein
MLEMKDGDEIHVVVELYIDPDDESPLTIRVRDQGGEKMMFKVKKKTKTAEIFSAYADHMGVDPAALRFTFDGVGVLYRDTTAMLEMEDGDQVESVIEQCGD